MRTDLTSEVCVMIFIMIVLDSDAGLVGDIKKCSPPTRLLSHADNTR